MRVIITGGSGLIGRALAADLSRDSHEVIVLSRRPEQIIGLPANTRAEKWDGRTAAGWHSLANGADAIVNLAGESIDAQRWTRERKQALRQSRLQASRAVVQAIESVAHKPGVVIQASGIGYYGPHGNEEIMEDTPPGHDFLAQLAAEWEASSASLELLGVRRVIVRTGVVLSMAGQALTRMLLPFRFFVGGRLGSGCQWFPWIHIADEVGAIRFLIDNKLARGPFNLTAPVPINNAGFSRLLGQQLRRPALIPVPAFVLRLVFGEMATIILDGQRAVPKRLRQMGFNFRFPEADMALEDLLK